jgi:NAD(P)H-hydrate repair Nnr-like enzyme with NAD(P)H-hydrate dehydratase domain
VDGDEKRLRIDGHQIAVNRGTPALLAAALAAARMIDAPAIYAFLVGDIGTGKGSRKLYQFLAEQLTQFDIQVLTFHYLQPDADWHNRVLFAVQALQPRPLLIADAGFMYAAKMSGQATQYDLFTPDAGELAFLADDLAPHPFYTRGFILHQHNHLPDLIQRAYQHQNSARTLVVKGTTDYIVHNAQIVATVDQPAFDVMEAVGGTGDTLTGLLSVLCGAGFAPTRAGELAARANRHTGTAEMTPATQVSELIARIPEALDQVIPSEIKERHHAQQHKR